MRFILFFIFLCLLSGQAAQGQETVPDCPSTPPSRLVIGQRGLILSAHPGDLFAEPRLSSEITETIPALNVFDVLEGPTCGDDFAWWHVRYDDQDGWMIEADYDRYFLEPLTPITAANIQQLSDYQLLGRGIFTTGVEWSSDGAEIMVGSTVGIVQFDAENLSAPSTWYDPGGNVCSVEFSDDGSGRWGFATCSENSAEIRTIVENPYGEHWYSYDGEIHEFEFIKNRDSLAIASENKVMVIEAGYSDLIWEAENRIVALDVSPNGLTLAATDGHQVVLGTPFSRLTTNLLDVGGMDVTSLALNFDGTLLAVGVGRQIQLWDVETRKMLAVHDNLGSVENPNCFDGFVRSAIMHPVNFHKSTAANTRDIEFSSDGQRLVTVTDNATLTIWNVSDTDIQQTDMIDAGGCAALTHLAFKPDGTQVAFITVDHYEPPSNTLSVWDIDSQRPAAISTNGYTATIYDMMFSSDSARLASAGSGGGIRLWNPISGMEITELSPSDGRAVAFSPDGLWVAALYQQFGGEASWWNLEVLGGPHNRAWVALRGSFFEAASSLAFSDQFLASDMNLRMEPSVNIWNVKNLLTALPSDFIAPDFSAPLTDAWSRMAFSPDNHLLAYSDFIDRESGTITLLDMNTHAAVRVLRGHTNPIWDVVFSPDSKLLVSVSGRLGPGVEYQIDKDDNTARVWDVETGEEKFVLQHDSTVHAAAFGPDGTFFATGTENGDINFWDSSTGEHLLTIHERYGGVNALAFSPDGVWFAASTGSVIKIYRIPAAYPFGEG